MDYDEGDIVYYLSTDGMRRVLVEYKDDDIKNGRGGFEGVNLNDNQPVWGYDCQIERVQHA